MNLNLVILGGILVGVGSSVLLLFNGRIAGISGIVKNLLLAKEWKNRQNLWRLFFVMGLLSGGLLGRVFAPEQAVDWGKAVWPEKIVIMGGFLVGFGTAMANGCTSGHGVCGIGRFSLRSLIATLLFIGAGIATVYVLGSFFEISY